MPRPKPPRAPKLKGKLLKLSGMTIEIIERCLPQESDRKQFLSEIYQLLESYWPLENAIDRAPRDKSLEVELNQLSKRAASLDESLELLSPTLREAMNVRLAQPVEPPEFDRYLPRKGGSDNSRDSIARIAESFSALALAAESASKDLRRLRDEITSLGGQLDERTGESRGGPSLQARDYVVRRLLDLIDQFLGDEANEGDREDIVKGALDAAGAPYPGTDRRFRNLVLSIQRQRVEASLHGKGTSRPE